MIFNDVVIGTKGTSNQYPVIGNNVTIYLGVKIFVNVMVGDNCVIGANSTVTNSIPESTIVAWAPAREIRKNSIMMNE